jgi:hypothetical protein
VPLGGLWVAVRRGDRTALLLLPTAAAARPGLGEGMLLVWAAGPGSPCSRASCAPRGAQACPARGLQQQSFSQRHRSRAEE